MRTSSLDTSIYIRPFRDADSPLLFAAARESIGDICAWMTWCTPGYSLEDSKSFVARSQTDWENGHSYSFAILDIEDDTFLGSVGLNHIDRVHNVANMGIWVRTSKTGQGVASNAIRLIATFAFEELRLSRMEILVAFDNQPSIRVAEKVRAKIEGVLRNRLVLAGKSHDAVMCSIIPADLQVQPPPVRPQPGSAEPLLPPLSLVPSATLTSGEILV
jgi:RimJ/RimL family protein N-acetyltransferase